LDADLDTMPPKVNAGINSDIQNFTTKSQNDAGLTPATWAKGLSRWDGSSPSYKNCKTSASVEPISEIYPLKVGSRACLVTTDDRVVRIRISGVDAGQRVKLEAVVWELSS